MKQVPLYRKGRHLVPVTVVFCTGRFYKSVDLNKELKIKKIFSGS